MTYTETLKTLPTGAALSSSFGNPGEGGYVEFHRTPDGRRFEVSNGTWEASAPFVWQAQPVEG